MSERDLSEVREHIKAGYALAQKKSLKERLSYNPIYWFLPMVIHSSNLPSPDKCGESVVARTDPVKAVTVALPFAALPRGFRGQRPVHMPLQNRCRSCFLRTRLRKPLQGAAEELLKANRSTLAPSSRKWIEIVSKRGTNENGVAYRFHISFRRLSWRRSGTLNRLPKH
jgi:hypothetical protein